MTIKPSKKIFFPEIRSSTMSGEMSKKRKKLTVTYNKNEFFFKKLYFSETSIQYLSFDILLNKIK